MPIFETNGRTYCLNWFIFNELKSNHCNSLKEFDKNILAFIIIFVLVNLKYTKAWQLQKKKTKRPKWKKERKKVVFRANHFALEMNKRKRKPVIEEWIDRFIFIKIESLQRLYIQWALTKQKYIWRLN